MSVEFEAVACLRVDVGDYAYTIRFSAKIVAKSFAYLSNVVGSSPDNNDNECFAFDVCLLISIFTSLQELKSLVCLRLLIS